MGENYAPVQSNRFRLLRSEAPREFPANARSPSAPWDPGPLQALQQARSALLVMSRATIRTRTVRTLLDKSPITRERLETQWFAFTRP